MSGKNKVTFEAKNARAFDCALFIAEKAPTYGQFIEWFMAKFDKCRFHS